MRKVSLLGRVEMTYVFFQNFAEVPGFSFGQTVDFEVTICILVDLVGTLGMHSKYR